MTRRRAMRVAVAVVLGASRAFATVGQVFEGGLVVADRGGSRRRLGRVGLAMTAPLVLSALVVAAPASTGVPLGKWTSSESMALVSAATSGAPVEVASQTTEDSIQYAMPDGSMKLTVSTQPVRVRRGTGWVPLDTTLVVNADGSVSPAATVTALTLSGGGSSPLITATRKGATVSWSWPGSLPVPTLDGDTAVYSEVLPGVDLRATAQPDGFSEVLVVKTAAAASLPQVLHPHFDVSVDHGRVSATPGGGFTVWNAAGSQAMSSGAPLMWDSSGTPSTLTSKSTSTSKSMASLDASSTGTPSPVAADGTADADQLDAPERQHRRPR